MGWKDGVRLFPKAVRLLDIPHYRKSVLAGLVLSLGSKTESTVGILLPALFAEITHVFRFLSIVPWDSVWWNIVRVFRLPEIQIQK
jgi:hypothetical protein